MLNRFAAILISSLLLFTACKPEEEKVTAEEAKKLALQIREDIDARKTDFIGKHIILPALIDRVSLQTEVKHASALERGMKDALKKHELEKNIYKSINENGSFQLVKQYEKEGKQRLIFRAFGGEGLNYVDMELTKLKNKVGIADIFIYLSGENMSKSMAEMLEKFMQNYDETIAKNTARNFESVKQLIGSGDFEEAKKVFARLPYSIRNTRMGELTYLRIASNLSEDEYLPALEKIEKKYGDDPNFQLMLIDIHILRKDYDKALLSVNKLDKMIDTDPFLNYFRGIIYYHKADEEQAILHYEKAVQSLPDFAEPRAELVVHYADLGNTEKAKEYFYQYKKLKNAKESMIQSLEDAYPFLNN